MTKTPNRAADSEHGGFGELDLDLPAIRTTEIANLPVVANDDDLPVVATFGDLPHTTNFDLPMAQAAELPTPGAALPTLADNSGLPMPAHADLPTPAHDDLPARAEDADLPVPAEVDLPLPSPERSPVHPQDIVHVDFSSNESFDIDDEDSEGEITEGFESGIRYRGLGLTRVGGASAAILVVGASLWSWSRLDDGSTDSQPEVATAPTAAGAAVANASTMPAPTGTSKADSDTSAERLAKVGRAKLRAGQAANALPLLQRAALMEPSRVDHVLHIAMAANELERWRDAERAVARGLALFPNHAGILWQKGVTLLKTDRITEALKTLTLAVHEDPELAEAHVTMATCHERLNDYPAAIASWRSAIALNDGVAHWQFRLAELLCKHHQPATDAIPHLLRAVELRSTDPVSRRNWSPRAHFYIGELLRSKRPRRALKAYREHLKVAPGSPYAVDARRQIEQLER